jgi:hypothetical protein
MDAAEAISNTHEWFEVNSGWAPPDEDELAEWLGDGVSDAPTTVLSNRRAGARTDSLRGG